MEGKMVVVAVVVVVKGEDSEAPRRALVMVETAAAVDRQRLQFQRRWIVRRNVARSSRGVTLTRTLTREYLV